MTGARNVPEILRDDRRLHPDRVKTLRRTVVLTLPLGGCVKTISPRDLEGRPVDQARQDLRRARRRCPRHPRDDEEEDLQHPAPDGFVGDVEPAPGKEILDVR